VQGSYSTGNNTISAQDFTGGVVGFNYGIVEYSYSTATISSTRYDNGGVVGFNEGGTVQYCYYTGDIVGSQSTGGVVGNSKGGTVKNCFATGKVFSNGSIFSPPDPGDSRGSNAGGVVGYINNGATVENCYFTGAEVKGTGLNVGGVAGRNESGRVAYCYAARSDVIGAQRTGGVVGWNDGGTVERNVALGKNVKNGDTYSNVGRVIGEGNGTNNYGRSTGMTITYNNGGATYTTSNNANGKDGADIIAANWNSASWWTGTALFSTSVWDIANNKLPLLKDMPGNTAQNPEVE